MERIGTKTRHRYAESHFGNIKLVLEINMKFQDFTNHCGAFHKRYSSVLWILRPHITWGGMSPLCTHTVHVFRSPCMYSGNMERRQAGVKLWAMLGWETSGPGQVHPFFSTVTTNINGLWNNSSGTVWGTWERVPYVDLWASGCGMYRTNSPFHGPNFI